MKWDQLGALMMGYACKFLCSLYCFIFMLFYWRRKKQKKSWLKTTRNWTSLLYLLYEINDFFMIFLNKIDCNKLKCRRGIIKNKPNIWPDFLIEGIGMAIMIVQSIEIKGWKLPVVHQPALLFSISHSFLPSISSSFFFLRFLMGTIFKIII